MLVGTVIWIVTGVLAVAMFGAGLSKLIGSRQKMIERTPFVADFSQGAVRAIGVLEVLGAAGLILPALLGIATTLAPVAATAIGLLMVGAVITHVRRGDGLAAAAPALVFGILAAVVAWARFGPYAF